MALSYVLEIFIRQPMDLISSIFSSDCYLFSPPNPLKKFYYKCDRKFHLDDLIELYNEYDDYAIILISGKRTEYYLYSTNSTKFLKGIDEELPNQHKTGGQSAQRFGRIRDEKIGWYAKKVVELMTKFYVKNGKFQHKGIIIAGPAEMKNLVCNHELFIKYFTKYLQKTLTISEINDQSILQVIQMSIDILTSESEENNLITQFESKLSDPKQIDLLVFGSNEVITAFKQGLLKEIYINDGYDQKDAMIKSVTKTKINVIRTINFSKKYGDLVGIRYFSSTESPIIGS